MHRVVIDGRGKITLTGAGKRRILYMNTCDPRLGITTSHCQDQATPRLVLQNITLANGNSVGSRRDGGGGGAVFVRGGRVKVVNSRFFNNRCEATGPDIGGAAIRVLDQFDDKAVYIIHSTFGGAPGYGGVCSNGGALSSIGVSWVVLNSLITHNRAIGRGANPPRRDAGRRQRRGHLQRRQPVPALRAWHGDAAQPGARGRWRDLLRQQRPHRDTR